MIISLSNSNFEVKPKKEVLKNLTYSTTEITPIQLYEKVINGYCFQNHYDYKGEFQFKGIGAKTNHYIGSYIVSIDIDHQKESMRKTLSKLNYLPTFSYETYSNKTGDYCYRFCYCFDDELKGKETYTEAYKNICIKNDIEELFDKKASDCYHYMNGTNKSADTIYYGYVYNVNDFVSVNTLSLSSVSKDVEDNINGNETFNKELIENIKKIGYAKAVQKYANTYRHFECSTLPEVNDETPLIDLKDYYEISRIWKKGDDGKCHIKKLENGQHRRFRIFYNLCIRRLICNDLSIDELLFAACWEMAYYIDNTDKKDKITLGQLMRIAYNAYNWNLKDFNYISLRKQMVNYKYCEKYNVTKKKVASIVGNLKKQQIKENKKDIFFKLYNDNLTINENIEYFFEKTGLTVGKSTVKRWKNEENLTRSYTKNPMNIEALKPMTLSNNINGNETFDDKSNTKIDLEKIIKEVENETLQASKCNNVDNYAIQTETEPHRAILEPKTDCLFSDYIKMCMNN